VTPLDALWHLLNFAVPAFALGLISAVGAKLLWRRELAAVSWWRLARDASLAALLVLLAGLVLTGHDGRMATYAAMVVASALMLWWRGLGPGRQ
jgi:hypothetical protein